MKIRSPWLIKVVGFAGAGILKLWAGIVRPRVVELVPGLDPRRKLKTSYIYTFWHENILVPCSLFGRGDTAVLISQHADGEMIAQVCEHLGFKTVRGSSTRGGIIALRKMIRSMGTCHIAIVPDGPRGPRRHLEPGLIFLAAKTGLPIVPVGIGYERPWRLRTWDRFVLPRPLNRACVILANPIAIPSDIDKESLERQRQLIENELEKVGELAEKMANK